MSYASFVRVYKTISGLNRHVKTYHSDDVDTLVIDFDNIRKVMYSACKTIFEDECYGKPTNVAFKKYFEEECFAMDNFVAGEFYSQVQHLCINLAQTKNKELFYSQLYETLAQDGKKFFPHMKGEESSLLIIISCEKFIKEVENLIQKPGPSEVVQKEVIFSARDFEIIQYLGGYVIRKLHYKIKGNSSNNIIAGSILACKNEDTQDQALVACLSRGGLWGITSHALHIFAAAEKSFREETGNEKSLSHINVDSMVNSLLLNPDNIQLLSTILEDYDLDMAKNQEFALTVLEKMFTFIRKISCCQKG